MKTPLDVIDKTDSKAMSANLQFTNPPSLNLTEGNVAENFKRWKRLLKNFMLASGASTLDEPRQTAIILECAGSEAMDVYDQFEFDKEEDKTNPEKVIAKFENYCAPRETEVLQAFRFWNCPYRAPFDTFVTELRTKADGCNFHTEKDRMVRDKIVFSVNSHLQERLLRESKLTLAKTIEICRASEASDKHMKEITHTSASSEAFVEKVQTKSNDQRSVSTAYNESKRACKFCGSQHVFKKHLCPAWGKNCEHCGGRNHFKRCCKKTGLYLVREEYPHEKPSAQMQEAELLAFTHRGSRMTALFEIHGNKIRFQIDTAADVNIISERYVDTSLMRKPKQSLVMWNGTKFLPLGEVTLPVVNPQDNRSQLAEFTVVQDGLTNLIGLKTSLAFGLITVNHQKFVAKITGTEDSSLGDLGETNLIIDEAAKPVVLPCRRIPFSIIDKVKDEIDTLVKRGILLPVHQPSSWVNQMAIVEKKNGKIRVCIDPQPLNKVLHREHFKLPTFDDIRPHFQNAKIFSKMDVKEAFWHVKLDETDSFLTTMITPWGRFRWSRLPYGLSVSSEIFQRRLMQALEGLPGVVTVADDIIVMGRGSTIEEASKDHERNLSALQLRCEEKKIRLNEEKTVLKQSEISFMGHCVSAQGVKPDPEKVKALLEAARPTDVHGIRRFCGMVQYLAKFVDNVSESLAPLQEMTRKNAKFEWSQQCEKGFNDIKRKIAEATMLCHYNPNLPLELHVDSSQSGIGCVLLQDSRPLEYASRSLTETEKKWAQIEKEMLAVVFGLERFDQYTYGNRIVVINDHKPLASIVKKPMSQAPARLQRLLMRANRYHFEFRWIQGSKLTLADYFSRICLVGSDEKGDSQFSTDREKWQKPNGISDTTVDKVARATAADPDLQKLAIIIQEGWPDDKSRIPSNVMPYFPFRDALSVDNGLILRGEAIVIPTILRKEMKNKLHAAHLGVDSMLRRARECIFWPGLMHELKAICLSCEPCQSAKPRNSKETLVQKPVETYPWEKVASDIFDIQGKQYLVLVDYFSNFIEVEQLQSLSSTAVIRKLKASFARYGIPKLLVTDSGPQFTSFEFKQFSQKWGFEHYKSDPHHHQANGKAEAAVKSVKNMMKKCLAEGQDQYVGLLELRCTPRQGLGVSPAQCVFGRRIRSLIPSVKACDEPNIQEDVQRHKEERNRTIKRYFDKRAHDLPTLKENEPVYYCDPQVPGWKRGRVSKKLSGRSYIIEKENGAHLRRNRVHLRKSQNTFRRIPSVGELEINDSLCDATVGGGFQPSRTERPQRPNGEEAPNRSGRPTRNRRRPAWMADYFV